MYQNLIANQANLFWLTDEEELEVANKDQKHPENVLGRYYVDVECIDCDVCRDTAPNNFTRQEDGSYSYVYKQPENEEEEAECQEAMESCPVEAIGCDGE